MNGKVTSVLTKREVPKDLQGIQGVSTGFDPPSVYESRFVILGEPGSGKSTLINSDPNIMVLDVESGGLTVADPQALRFTAPPRTDPSQLDKVYYSFIDRVIARKLSGKDDVKMIAIDSIDKMIEIALGCLCLRAGVADPIMSEDKKSGNLYTQAKLDVFGALDKAFHAGLGWALIAHMATRTVRVGQEQKEQKGLAVSDSFKRPVFRECEHMLFVSRGVEIIQHPTTTKKVGGKTITIPGKTENVPVRKLRSKPGGLWAGGDAEDVKVRVPFETEIVIPPKGGFGTLKAAYDRAVETLTSEETTNG
jgi:GTPase SAR1 family protein